MVLWHSVRHWAMHRIMDTELLLKSEIHSHQTPIRNHRGRNIGMDDNSNFTLPMINHETKVPPVP